MFSQIVLQLDVELDETEHRHCHGDSFEDLYPNVGELWRQAVDAIDIVELCDDCHDCEQHSDEAVLKNADPDYL